MRLERLALKNFRQHVATEVIFERGLSGIIGANGSGKSTLIEAIAFALYGSKAVRGKVDDLKTRSSRKNLQLEVVLWFEHGPQLFRLERTLSDARLFIGGEAEPCSRGTREVSDRITQILGMNYDEFASTFFTEQKGLEFLSGQKGAVERERFILRMMGYDRLERMQERLRVDRRDRKIEISAWEAGLGDRSLLEAKIAQEERGIKPLRDDLSAAGQVLKNAEREVELHKSEVATLKERYDLYVAAGRKLNDLSIRFEEQSLRTKALEGELRACQEKLTEDGLITRSLDDKAPNQNYASRLSQKREELSELAASIASAELSVTNLTLEWQKGVAELSAEMSVKRRDIAVRSARLQELNTLSDKGQCPTCEQQIGEAFEKVLKVQSQEINTENGILSELESRLTEAKNPPQTLEEARAKLKALQQLKLSAEQNLSLMIEQRNEIERAERIQSDLVTLREDLKHRQLELEKARADVKQIDFSEDRYRAALNKLDTCERLQEVARLQRVKIEGQLNTQEALLARSRQELRDHDERSALLNSSKRGLLVLEESDKVLSDLRRALNSMLRPRLAELAGEFLADLTDGRYATVEIGHDFSPAIVEDGELKPIISGGEEDLLNLCVRLALSQLLAERAGQSFSLLVLDEVFGSLDEGRRTNVLMLLERLSDRFDQILVITHLEDIRDGVQHLLSVQYDEHSGVVSLIDAFASNEGELAANV